VKTTAHLGSIPFILYSGNITDAVRRQAQQMGACAVLSKPYNFSEFVEILAQALETP
jgi:CheY-like chemotaxis protein